MYFVYLLSVDLIWTSIIIYKYYLFSVVFEIFLVFSDKKKKFNYFPFIYFFSVNLIQVL